MKKLLFNNWNNLKNYAKSVKIKLLYNIVWYCMKSSTEMMLSNYISDLKFGSMKKEDSPVIRVYPWLYTEYIFRKFIYFYTGEYCSYFKKHWHNIKQYGPFKKNKTKPKQKSTVFLCSQQHTLCNGKLPKHASQNVQVILAPQREKTGPSTRLQMDKYTVQRWLVGW